MPVEEFVAGWISGETFFFLLSHHPQWWITSWGRWVTEEDLRPKSWFPWRAQSQLSQSLLGVA